MRPIRSGAEVGGANLMRKHSLAPAIKELWNVWEIHCLIIASLFLQVFLLLTAGMRRRSTSHVLRTLLWLAYLSADFVAIFVLGHLAVHASQPGHQLMFFWAPFVLVHLGGQDTITAFSRQDNELWRRHLLSLVTQVALAGYVVAKASWPDLRLTVAMVVMFLSGCFKYAERTYCLFMASPAHLRTRAQESMSHLVRGKPMFPVDRRDLGETLDMMSKGSSNGLAIDIHDTDILYIMAVDTPINMAKTILGAEALPEMLKNFLACRNRCRAYEYVGELLVQFYQHNYTKILVRELYVLFKYNTIALGARSLCLLSSILLYYLFQHVSTTIALILFWSAEKEGQLHTASRADIMVSYILFLGAIVQDVSSAIRLIFSNASSNLPARIIRVANYIWSSCWRGKLWSEKLAQYSMIKRHIKPGTAGVPSMRQWIGWQLGAWGTELLDVTQIPITEDHTPMKEFILDNLLRFGKNEEWSIASSRGHLALQKWMESMDRQQTSPDPAGNQAKALIKSTSSSVDFPASVLIWHIATDICYYYGDNTNSVEMKKHKQLSREISNYVMYLVFKCGVMLNTNSLHVHEKAHSEIRDVLSSRQGQQIIPSGEEDAIKKLFEANREEHQETAEVMMQSTRGHLQKLKSILNSLDSPVLPRACAVARELISIANETKRWDLIANVWSEMLYYTAPRCGSAFHCEHLSTGGEFVTHVLLLMYHLGPFLPYPDV